MTQLKDANGTAGLTYSNLELQVEHVLRAGSGGALINDAALIQAAVSAYAYDRRIVLDGDFTITDATASITLPSGTHLEGRPGCTITKGAVSQLPIFTAYGSVGSTVNLTGNAARGARTLSFTTTGITAGDWLMLKSTALWSASEAGAVQGELVHVKSVAVGSVTLYSPLNDAYTTANTANVAKVTFNRDVTVKGIKWICDTPTTGNGGLLSSRYTKDLNVLDTAALDYSGSVLFLETGIGTNVDGGNFQNGCITDVTGDGFGYGVDLAGAQQGATVNNITGHNGRNLITTNGSTRGGVPRDCTITNSTVSGEWAVSGFHTHYVGERIHFSNCGGTGKFTGGLVHLSGKNCTASDCWGGDVDGNGIYVEASSVNAVIADPVFKNIRGASCRGVTDQGADTKIYGGVLDTVVDGSEMVYTEGTGMFIKGLTLIPGASKIGFTSWDSSDTWHAVDLTVVNATTGVNYGTVGGTVTPTPRVINLTTSSVTTPCNAAGAVISRSAVGTQTLNVPGVTSDHLRLTEQASDVAVPGSEGAEIYTKNLASGNAGSGLYFRDTQRIHVMLGQLQGTTTWNPGNVLNGAITTTTLTVTGAAVNDPVLVSFPLLVGAAAATAGITLTGQVTATNTVTVTLRNDTGGAVDLDSGAVRALVFKW